ncbi:MAG: bifunctional hydroxymethylpyrimidine kinase/phosphomethylpyrimidine kinase [Natronomonas sp.]
MGDHRDAAPVEKPVVLTIAGSDSGGGAGIQADLKTIEATGGFGTSAVTAVTAQNTTGVESSHVLPIEEIEAQLDAVLSDFDVRAAKTGMLATTEVVETVTAVLEDASFPTVVDPVMVAATGDRLLTEAAESAYEDLVAAATVVTPNADEAAVLTDIEPTDEASAVAAAEAVREMGADAALIKGGHIESGDGVADVLVDNTGTTTFRHPRIDTDATHGSGCTLSAATATRLAVGDDVRTAVAASTEFMQRAVRYHHAVGSGPGAVHHMVGIRDDAAREPTAEAVVRLTDRLVDAGVRRLIPAAGSEVVGATPYAESTAEIAAIEGRLVRTMDGATPVRGVRFGASGETAERLLAVREHDPRRRFAASIRFDGVVRDAALGLGWAVAEAAESGVDAVVSPEGTTGVVFAETGGELADRLASLRAELPAE